MNISTRDAFEQAHPQVVTEIKRLLATQELAWEDYEFNGAGIVEGFAYLYASYRPLQAPETGYFWVSVELPLDYRPMDFRGGHHLGGVELVRE